MSLQKKITYTIFSNWTILFLNIIISFFLTPFIVHQLGNVYYGIWAIVMQFTGYLYLMDFGVRDSVIRYTSRLNAKRAGKRLNEVISAAVVLYSAIGVISIVVVLAGAWAFPLLFQIPAELTAEVRIVVLLSGLTIALMFVFNVFSGILLGLQQFYLFNIFHVVLIFVRVGLIVYLLGSGYRIVALASIQLFIGASSGILLVILARKLLADSGLPLRFYLRNKKRFLVTARQLFNYSIFVFIINIASKVIFTTDALVIGLFMNVGWVTFYAIAGSLIEYLKQLMTTSSSIFNPVTSHFDALGEKEKVREVLCSGSRFNLFIGFPIAVTYILLGYEFIDLWMGPEYALQAGTVLIILAATQLLTFHQYTISGIIFGLSKHKALAWWRVGEAIANLGLSVILIKPFGIAGVAMGTAIPHILVSLVVFPLYARTITGIALYDYWKRAFLPPILAIIPFVILAWLIKQTVVIESLLAYFSYIAIITLCYLLVSFYVVLQPGERSHLVTMIKKKLRAGTD
ncbi:polysaccharide biosynthesis C-terminal domain-containing protein [bacterium]|nr:polysaccharide biosynthesis C-terminal domain-containing protein [bacterium]